MCDTEAKASLFILCFKAVKIIETFTALVALFKLITAKKTHYNLRPKGGLWFKKNKLSVSITLRDHSFNI